MLDITKIPPFRFNTGELFDTACLIFAGNVDSKNGCRVMYKKNRVIAHRLAYSLAYNEELDASDIIKHTCKYVNCVNPAHLIRISKSQFIDDKTKEDIKFNYECHMTVEDLARLYELPANTILKIVTS